MCSVLYGRNRLYGLASQATSKLPKSSSSSSSVLLSPLALIVQVSPYFYLVTVPLLNEFVTEDITKLKESFFSVEMLSKSKALFLQHVFVFIRYCAAPGSTHA